MFVPRRNFATELGFRSMIVMEMFSRIQEEADKA